MSKRFLAFLGFFILGIFAFGRLTHLLPFDSALSRWSLQEDYTQFRVPQNGSVLQSHCAASEAGIVIGMDSPGYVEWRFARPGPFPTVIQPFFDRASGQPGQITLRTPSHPVPRVLFRNMPIRNRPFDISNFVQKDSAFALRFEGAEARLEDLRLYEPLQKPPFPWAVLIVFIGWITWTIKSKRRKELCVALVAAAGFYFRWITFCTYYSLPLEGDAVGYWALGQALQWAHPFVTGAREPGFIWVAALARLLFGNSIRSLRFMGILLSTLCIPAVVEAALAAEWPFWVGLGAAALVAANPFAIFMSVQGYQLEFFTLLILLFSAAWLRHRSRAMGWTGALLGITRVQSFLAVIPLVGLSEWEAPWSAKERRVFWVPFLVVSIFYFAAVHRETGSFLGHIDRHAGFYEAIEAQDAGKTAPPKSPATLGHFLFAPGHILRRSTALAKGYAEILFDPTDPFNRILLNSHYARAWNLLWLPFFWLGLAACLIRAPDRHFLWLPLLFLSGLPMLHDLIREPRLLFHVQPFAALLVMRGIWFAALARPGKRSAS